ncbi:MAG: tRNA (cytidine(34)-2'-O)-methyltransferase [Betaproteobacteria bacterium]|nr:tRNA (cytidine(34)-2'-O)-methyltransferase [Betaproteobacteria bacterium]PWB59542.1 MAG: tRNA (uridine(34)/cytosine(34)/5-carboxymethylaminomethyluridine(34)-2'-O)-methyltransferase TrmL [Betaproteobacteria bacterium]
MVDVVLVNPEIPPNAGNVIRLCANTGTPLHLVEPLGFSMDDRQLRRAGLDYHEMANVTVHSDWASCEARLSGRRLFAFTTRGLERFDRVRYRPDDVFVFGPETAGLPEAFLAGFPPGGRIRLPMIPGNRSLNLSNAVAVAVFEAWRQAGYAGSWP